MPKSGNSSVRVQFDDIPLDGLRLEIKDESWFPHQEVTRITPVVALVFLKRDGKRVLMEGTLSTDVEFPCDRCLEKFQCPLTVDFRLDFELVGKGQLDTVVADHLCSEEEMDMVYVDEPAIDVFHVLRQQVYMSLPFKKLCSPKCKGLCEKCGVNRNLTECKCASESTTSPFSVLAKLKH